jgi:hypothetical protein
MKTIAAVLALLAASTSLVARAQVTAWTVEGAVRRRVIGKGTFATGIGLGISGDETYAAGGTGVCGEFSACERGTWNSHNNSTKIKLGAEQHRRFHDQRHDRGQGAHASSSVG